MQLLDFQEIAKLQVTTCLVNNKCCLLQSATASGKTVIACSVIKEYAEQQKKNVLILVNLQALVGQFYETLEAFNVKASVLHDEITRDKKGNLFNLDWKNKVQLTMPITLINTINGTNKLTIDTNWVPDLIVIDEAHKGTSLYFQIIRDKFPKAKILGLTATPYREKNEEGEHLTEWYGDNLVTTISVKELIAIGRLVQPEYYMMDEDSHIVNTYIKLAKGKKTIVFTRDTAHSLKIKEAFLAQNIIAEIITSGTEVGVEERLNGQTPLQRQKIYDEYENGKIDVLVSVNALCEGFDCPIAEVCMLARNVGNHALFHQMVGRVLRAYFGKLGAMIIDFHDNIKNYGHIEDYQWTLDCEVPDVEYVKRGETLSFENFQKKSSVYYTCHTCSHVYDIKKNGSCKHCFTIHGFQTKSTAYDLLRPIFELNNAKDFGQLKARFKAALSTPIAQELINKRAKKEIFNIATGALMDEYSFIPKALALKNGSDELFLAA